MMRAKAFPVAILGVVILGLAIGPSLSAAPRASQSINKAPPPGEGVLCAAALYSVVAEVGARCRVGQDPEFQAELRRSVALLDEYLAKNGAGTPEQLAEFKRIQGHVGTPESLLCKGDALIMYDSFKQIDLKRLRSTTDEMVARSGKPTWGTCL